MTARTSDHRGGIGEVLRIAFPLILASSGHAFRLFADRVMLARYSQEAIAAAMPAGLGCFALMSFFIGTAGYSSAFVSQYIGAGRPRRAGLAVWQGLYVAALGGIVVAALGGLAEPIFGWMGHPPAVQHEQVRYFRVLSQWSFGGIGLAGLNAFWSGRGKTLVVMVIELICAALNVLLNYLLIFGAHGFPELGILGAGLATGISNLLGFAIGLVVFVLPRNRAAFGTLPGKTFDRPLLFRLLRYGSPSGAQFLLDLVAFNLFVVFMGRLGAVELEAASISFGLNALAFLPMIGMGMAVSVLVGRGVGAGDIPYAVRAARSAIMITLTYSVVIAAGLLFLPDIILAAFVRPGDTTQAETLAMATRCLRYITAYLAFDALAIVYSHAIKGAGDTRFAMIAGVSMSWLGLVLPCAVALSLGAGVWALWRILVIHVVVAGTVYYLRYRTGKWKSMRVIEEPAPGPSPAEVDIQAERGI